MSFHVGVKKRTPNVTGISAVSQRKAGTGWMGAALAGPLVVCGKQNSEYAPDLWGSQSWLPPAFSRRLRGSKTGACPKKPPERRLQARLPAPQNWRNFGRTTLDWSCGPPGALPDGVSPAQGAESARDLAVAANSPGHPNRSQSPLRRTIRCPGTWHLPCNPARGPNSIQDHTGGCN